MAPKFSMKLDWKEFNVCLETMEVWLKANAGEHYCGNSADSSGLTLWFLETPSQEIQDDIQAKWDLIDEVADEAVAYKSSEDRRAEAEAKRVSARAKLAALGLSEDEVKALFG